jgi:hypothetical protein
MENSFFMRKMKVKRNEYIFYYLWKNVSFQRMPWYKLINISHFSHLKMREGKYLSIENMNFSWFLFEKKKKVKRCLCGCLMNGLVFIKSVIKWHFYIFPKFLFHLDSHLTFFLLFFFLSKKWKKSVWSWQLYMLI